MSADTGAVQATGTRKRANDLDGKTWTKYSISIWSDIRKTPEEMRLGHPAMFPIALVTRLIRVFTTSDERVILDPFAGVGSTPIAAQLLGRDGIGIELSPEYVEIARQRQVQFGFLTEDGFELPSGSGTRRIIQGDARHLLTFLEPETVDLVVTSPPYWDILSRKRTADYKETRDYGDLAQDLGKVADYEQFLAELMKVFEQVYTVLKPGKYCIVIVMDIRKKDSFYPFHSDVADMMRDIGFIYDDLIIWDRRHEYNNLRPLGYPSVFRVNKVHEFILIFKKPPGADG